MTDTIPGQDDLEVHAFEKGDIILKEGETNTKVYVLKEGAVAINIAGEEICRICTPHSIFGEVSALLCTETSATVEAVEPSSLWVIDDFRSFMVTHPDYALSIADNFIKAGGAKNILVIGADTLAATCDPTDRSTIVIFGDGAGAVIVTASEDEGILSTHINADGRFGDLLKLPNVQRGNVGAVNDAYLSMAGNDVFKVAVKKLSQVVIDTLAANNIGKEQLDWLVPHQANKRIISATAKKLGMSMDQVILTLEGHGNTSAASVPLAFDEGVRSGKIQPGHLVLLEAFGGGFTWGSALVRM